METWSHVNDILRVAAAFSLFACGQSTTRDTDTSYAAVVGSSTRSSGIADVVAAPRDSGNWVVTEYGIGRIRAGMTVKEARAAVPGFKPAVGADSVGCDYASVPGLPQGVSVMVEDGVVGR